MNRDPAADARALVTERFPRASWAVVTGAVLTRHRTPGSDLDIVVLLPDGDPEAPHRESLHFRGWPVELFVHDPTTLAHYLATELPERRPTLHHMVATGTPVLGEPRDWQRRCAAVLAAGPGPLPPDQVDRERYALTDLLDDLRHAPPGEVTAVAGAGWIAGAEAALRLGGHWVGRGKWLLRELHDMDPALAGEWLAAAGSPELIAALIHRVLGRAGGELFDGYRAAGERPGNAPDARADHGRPAEDPPGPAGPVRITAVRDAQDRPGWLAAADDGRPVGSALLRMVPADGVGELTAHVHPAERRRGTGSRLLEAAVAAARQAGLRAVTTEAVTQDSPGDRFCAARGLRPVLALTYTRLDLAAVAVPEEERRAGYRLVSWEGTVPDDLAATFAGARRAMDDMPMDDADYEPPTWDVAEVHAIAEAVAKRGDHLLTVAAVAADGSIAGFTELVVPASGTGDGQHYGTGVLPEHRGHGLARSMKIASIRLVRDRFPQLGGLLADTADSNTFMRRINDDLGYVPTHRSLIYQQDLT